MYLKLGPQALIPLQHHHLNGIHFSPKCRESILVPSICNLVSGLRGIHFCT
jgi:hypothetical protein